jgi:hypothetical protein
MRTFLLVLALLASMFLASCAAKYKRGVDYERRGYYHVVAVDALWWKILKQCQIVIYIEDSVLGPPGIKGITIDDVHPSLCGEKVKAP